MRITQGKSISPQDAESMPMAPEFCSCGNPILTVYRNADGFCCMACAKGGK